MAEQKQTAGGKVTATKSGECRFGRDIHSFLPRCPSFVNLVAVTFSVPNASIDALPPRPPALNWRVIKRIMGCEADTLQHRIELQAPTEQRP